MQTIKCVVVGDGAAAGVEEEEDGCSSGLFDSVDMTMMMVNEYTN